MRSYSWFWQLLYFLDRTTVDSSCSRGGGANIPPRPPLSPSSDAKAAQNLDPVAQEEYHVETRTSSPKPIVGPCDKLLLRRRKNSRLSFIAAVCSLDYDDLFDPDTAPQMWKVSDALSGQRLGGRGPPNYGIIPKWELSPNYPAFGIILKLSSDCWNADKSECGRIGSQSWNLHYFLFQTIICCCLVGPQHESDLTLNKLMMTIKIEYSDDYDINPLESCHRIGRVLYWWPGVRFRERIRSTRYSDRWVLYPSLYWITFLEIPPKICVNGRKWAERESCQQCDD